MRDFRGLQLSVSPQGDRQEVRTELYLIFGWRKSLPANLALPPSSSSILKVRGHRGQFIRLSAVLLLGNCLTQQRPSQRHQMKRILLCKLNKVELFCQSNAFILRGKCVNDRKFSPHQLVVFGQTLRPAGSTCLNLRERETDR